MNTVQLVLSSLYLMSHFGNMEKRFTVDLQIYCQINGRAGGIQNCVICIKMYITVLCERDNIVCVNGE